jgi:hypothetical protein
VSRALTVSLVLGGCTVIVDPGQYERVDGVDAGPLDGGRDDAGSGDSGTALPCTPECPGNACETYRIDDGVAVAVAATEEIALSDPGERDRIVDAAFVAHDTLALSRTEDGWSVIVDDRAPLAGAENDPVRWATWSAEPPEAVREAVAEAWDPAAVGDSLIWCAGDRRGSPGSATFFAAAWLGATPGLETDNVVQVALWEHGNPDPLIRVGETQLLGPLRAGLGVAQDVLGQCALGFMESGAPYVAVRVLVDGLGDGLEPALIGAIVSGDPRRPGRFFSPLQVGIAAPDRPLVARGQSIVLGPDRTTDGQLELMDAGNSAVLAADERPASTTAVYPLTGTSPVAAPRALSSSAELLLPIAGQLWLGEVMGRDLGDPELLVATPDMTAVWDAESVPGSDLVAMVYGSRSDDGSAAGPEAIILRAAGEASVSTDPIPLHRSVSEPLGDVRGLAIAIVDGETTDTWDGAIAGVTEDATVFISQLRGCVSP